MRSHVIGTTRTIALAPPNRVFMAEPSRRGPSEDRILSPYKQNQCLKYSH